MTRRADGDATRRADGDATGRADGVATRTKTFVVLTAAGWAVMAFGVYGVLQDATRTKPPAFALWFFGALAVHDFVVAPLVFLSGRILRRAAPASARATIVAALACTALIAAYASPLIAGVGRRPDNASLHPSGYAVPVLVVVAAIWTVAVAVRLSPAGIAAVRSRTRSFLRRS